MLFSDFRLKMGCMCHIFTNVFIFLVSYKYDIESKEFVLYITDLIFLITKNISPWSGHKKKWLPHLHHQAVGQCQLIEFKVSELECAAFPLEINSSTESTHGGRINILMCEIKINDFLWHLLSTYLHTADAFF